MGGIIFESATPRQILLRTAQAQLFLKAPRDSL
jgi:hypothetical protein